MIETLRAVFADIDGTLVTKGEQMMPITRRALETLHSQGVLIGLSTGRKIGQGMFRRAEDWELSFQFDMMIGMNGGQLWDKDHENIEDYYLLDPKDMQEILAKMEPLGINAMIYEEDYIVSQIIQSQNGGKKEGNEKLDKNTKTSKSEDNNKNEEKVKNKKRIEKKIKEEKMQMEQMKEAFMSLKINNNKENNNNIGNYNNINNEDNNNNNNIDNNLINKSENNIINENNDEINNFNNNENDIDNEEEECKNNSNSPKSIENGGKFGF